MNRKQKLLLGCFIFTFLFCVLPISMGATVTRTVTIDNGYYAQISLSRSGTSGSFTSTGTVTAFITDNAGHGGSSAGSTWSATGTSDSWNIPTFPSAGPWYLVFANGSGSQVQVTAIIDATIPGFELLYAFFALLAIFGIFCLKKKSII